MIRENSREDIIEASRELVVFMVELNDVRVEDISFILFTVTPDIDAAFPASAVRLMGEPWSLLACIDVLQMNVDGAVNGLIRALMVAETERGLGDIVHPYLRGAEKLRPDRSISRD